MRRHDENTNGNAVEHYYLQDANFNVTAVVDNVGAVVERYAYSPYGKVTVLDANFIPTKVSGDYDCDGDVDGDDVLAWQRGDVIRLCSAIDNEILYTGRRRDPETGLQLNRNRFYHASLGRWVNRDPIGYLGGTWNLYNYLNSNPVTGLDPLGLEGNLTCGEQTTKNRRDRLRCKNRCSSQFFWDLDGGMSLENAKTKKRSCNAGCGERFPEPDCGRDDYVSFCEPEKCIAEAAAVLAWELMCTGFPGVSGAVAGFACGKSNPFADAYKKCLNEIATN